MNKYYTICAAISLYISAHSLVGFAQMGGMYDGKELDFLVKNTPPRPKLIIFSADWCLPCKVARKEMRENMNLKRIVDTYEVVKYDFDKNVVEKKKYNVNKVPTYIIEAEGIEVRRQIGFGGTKKLIDFLD
tara:strand:- start:95 stop:487 length:393 start_codon:yes stop_codon:yes gene_type:complete